MKKRFKDILIKFILNDGIFNEEGLGYLIIDKSSSHFPEDILNYNNIHKANIDITYIHSRMTRYLQPIDFSINKTFKAALREKYVSFWTNDIY